MNKLGNSNSNHRLGIPLSNRRQIFQNIQKNLDKIKLASVQESSESNDVILECIVQALESVDELNKCIDDQDNTLIDCPVSHTKMCNLAQAVVPVVGELVENVLLPTLHMHTCGSLHLDVIGVYLITCQVCFFAQNTGLLLYSQSGLTTDELVVDKTMYVSTVANTTVEQHYKITHNYSYVVNVTEPTTYYLWNKLAYLSGVFYWDNTVSSLKAVKL